MRSPRNVTCAPIGNALAELELRDRQPGLGDLRLLAGDRGEVADGAVDQLGVAGRLADAHVHDDLRQGRHLHHVLVRELLAQGGEDLLAVPGLEARHGACLALLGRGAHQISLSVRLAIRTLRCAE
jgi:hypothetical protein